MDFDRSVLNAVIHFPQNTYIMEFDLWITAVSECYFLTALIEIPLIKYMRHGNNVSPCGMSKGYSLPVKIYKRMYQLACLLKIRGNVQELLEIQSDDKRWESNMDICAGIVLYNPDIQRLKENIVHIRSQVEHLVLVDNGSVNLEEVKRIVVNLPNVTILENGSNLGIAIALNRVVEFADTNDFEWLLTLDQDSVSEDHLIEQYIKFLTNHKEECRVGCLTCNIVDRNFALQTNNYSAEYEYIDYCITSGSLMSIAATKNVGGFDDSMFIDKVDCDICINLRKKGYKIIRMNYNGLLHEIGHARQINLGFRKWELYNHSSFRRYYMCRNASYLLRKYHDGYVTKMFAKEIFQFVLVLLFEDEKKDKSIKGLRGFADGFKAPIA